MPIKSSDQAVNVDLLHERKSATFDSEEFAQWWAGGVEPQRQRRALEKFFFNDPEFDDQQHISYMSHKELYEHSVARATKFLQKLRQWYDETNPADAPVTIELLYNFRLLMSGPLGTALFQQSFPLRLHFSMFVPTLLGQGTQEQQQEWLQKAWNMHVIGSYAQTELGHGTFVRGLETRADYDVAREEFVLNTPTLTSYKWWPGGMGHTVNMAIVMAQLYVEDKHCGLHAFLLRIRNEDTHMPEQGVEVGEIGSKIGFNAVNNGYLALRNVRIPRKQMLMKHAQVLADGTFVKGNQPLLIYGTMVYSRVMILRDVSFSLLQAATIATRYSAVRRQSPIDINKTEPQIFDHVTQQAKVLPQLAKGIIYHLVADHMWTMYQQVNKELKINKQENLPELHALSCCMKAICSHQASEGIEILRKACGGQGYMASANFAQIYGVTTATCTYEGENTVMLLQAARFLLKSYVNSLRRKVLPRSVTYFRDVSRIKWSNEHLFESMVRALEIAAVGKTGLAFEYQRHLRKGRSEQEAANLAGLKLTQAASMHGKAFLARFAYEQLEKLATAQMSHALSKVLAEVFEIFVLDMFLNSLSDVLRFNVLHEQQIAEVELRYELVLVSLRRNAVAIVDGFDFHDRVLGSTLGCFDGRVYERLMEEAKKSPLNQEHVNKTFDTHLKPFMKAKL